MVQPIDYASQVASPVRAAMEGYKLGATIRTSQEAQIAKEKALADQAKMHADLAAVADNPNASANDYASIMTKYPQIADKLKVGWGALSEDRQKNSINQAAQAYSALSADKPDAAKEIVQQQLDAAKNAGDQEGVQHAQTMLKLIDMDPKHAKDSVGLMLAATMGPKEFANTFKTLNATPSVVANLSPTLQQAVKDDLVDPKSITPKNQPMWEQLAANGMLTNAGKIPSQAVVDAAQRGDLNPKDLNSRNIAIYNRLYKSLPKLSVTAAAADIKTKTEMQKQLGVRAGNVATNIKVLDKNMPLLYDTGDKGNASGFKIIDNGWLSLSSKFSNNPLVARYMASIRTARAEYAKMLANGGTPTVEDKKEATDMIPIGHNGDYYRGLGQQFRTEGDNIIGVLNDVKKSIQFGNPKGGFINESAPKSDNSVTVEGKIYNRPASFTDQQWADYKKAVGAQ